MYFKYGDKEISYLKKKDQRLAEAIAIIGHIHRSVDSDLFSSLVNSIVGQQISSAAQKTIWQRMTQAYGTVTAEALAATDLADIQKFGITFKKAEYIKKIAEKIQSGQLNLDSLKTKDDGAVIAELVALDGVGVWTAEMLLTFCLQRPDIMSYGDLAILRGLRMLHRHRKIDRKLFEKYRRRYSPYGSVASLYLWAIAAGAVESLADPAARKTGKSA